MARLGVLAMGNVLRGDDGLGPAALEALRARYELGPEVELRDLGLPGSDLALALEGLDAAWVVDAVRGAAPGALVRREVAEPAADPPDGGRHGATLRGALAELAAAGARAPRRTVLVGLGAGSFELGAALSRPVRGGLAALVDALAGELAAAGAPVRPRAVGVRLRARGVVQGVGMRPFVYRLAREEALAGRVWNGADGVTIEAFGPPAAIARFRARLAAELPAAARLDAVDEAPLPAGAGGALPAAFEIAPSPASDAAPHPSIPPDLALCAACARELADPADRRHRYPFTCCTACGPRYTLALDVPYDRARTTMARFALCPACRREYEDPASRRFHAEPNACPACGPRLVAWRPAGPDARARPAPGGEEALATAVAALLRGEIVAVKGLGGYHLACDATSPAAVGRLRGRKARDEKPFAVMAPDLAAAERLAALGPAERDLLTSPAAPIVLAPARAGSGLAPQVAPGTALVGLFLPYTPLHRLLLAGVARPLVMTSGNLAEEPLAWDDDDAAARLGPLADVVLAHDRPIAAPADDSVARAVLGAPLLLRRARGYVPGGLALPVALPAPALAAGALLKNAPALATGGTAWLAPHVGDVEGPAALDAFERAVALLARTLRAEPRLLVRDLHPEYATSRWAEARAARDRAPCVPVQHHHAHAAAAMAERGLPGPALALAWDGAGLGLDGAAWGGELLLARYEGFERLATLRPLPLAGGDLAVREPWRLALAALDDAHDGAPPLDRLALFDGVDGRAVAVVRRMIAAGVNAPPAHGAGRLLDALAAIALARPCSRFEGQLPLALEGAALASGDGGALAYPVDLDLARAPWQLDPRPLVRAAVADLLGGVPAGPIAARIHAGLARGAAALVRAAIRAHGPLPVLLTGGCFANARLAEELARALAPDAEPLPHRRVPPGDGGLALGQLAVAAAIARRDGLA